MHRERWEKVKDLFGSAVELDPSQRSAFLREACESCRHYLLSIDVASDPKAVPLVDELAAIPLDLYARDRGFTKITPNLMGF